jgi:hypothetical protein
MMLVIRIVARLFIAAAAFAAFGFAAPASAQQITAYVSSTGSDSNPCTAAQPCQTINQAVRVVGLNGEIFCLNSPFSNVEGLAISQSMTIDCPGALLAGVFGQAAGGLLLSGADRSVTIRNLTFNGTLLGSSNVPAVQVLGSGTLILENCTFEHFPGIALDIEPNAAFTLVIRNSRISNSASGILLKPAAGGSINATLDHVTITNNTGGGIKADSSNGPINVDISDSVISENGANGLNISSGTGTQNDMVSITRSTIAKNGLVGIQTGGSNGAVMLDATLLDSNVDGATVLVGGGRILSYGNNRIVGSAGSGFTGSLGLQ